LKQSDGRDLLIQGSSTLYVPLLAAGLIDRLVLMTFPVLLGEGKRIFDGKEKPGALKMVDHLVTDKGVVIASYEPDGEVPTGTFETKPPSEEELEALLFAWTVCKHTKSNAIVYARKDQTVGVGAGQMSRIDSVKIGAMRAQLPVAGSVLASDAFFPFRDGIDEAAKYGITAVIQPGGSVRDEEVIAAANEHGLAMVFTGIRHFKH